MARWLLYAAIFLTPLFFLPWTLFPLNLNKQFLLTSLVLLALISWLIKSVVKGELIFAKNYLSWFVLALVAFTGLSAFFSKSRSFRFVGLEGSEVDVLINLLTFGLLYFLLGSVSKKESELKNFLSCFLWSSLLVLLMSVSHFLGFWFWPWSFTKVVTFNTIGTTNALAIYFGLALVVLLSLICKRVFVSRVAKIATGIFAAALFISILLISYWPVFIGLALIMLALLTNNNFISKWLLLSVAIVSIFIVLVSFNFIKLKLPIFDLPAEITPSLQASWNVAKNTIQEGAKNFVFGSGPATFSYQYSLYRNPSLNSTSFWDLRFSQGYNAILTHLVNWGFIGTILFLAVLIYSLILISKLFFNKHASGSSLAWAIESGIVYLVLLLFFYPQNYVLYFSLFLFLGLLVAKNSIISDKYQSLSLTESSRKTFIFSLGMMILVALSTLALYINGQRYIGALYFAQGVKIANTSGDIDQALPYLLSGLDLDPKNDSYLQTLSSAFLIKVNNDLNKANLLSKALQMARRSTEVNPRNSANWLILAKTYESIILLVSGAAEESFKAYDEAIKLEPNNPAIYAGLGRAHLALADRFTQELSGINKEKRNLEYSLAIANFDKALSLKSDYAPAHFSLVQVFDRQGKTEEAIARGERLRSIALSDSDKSNDVGILFQLGLLHYQAGRLNKSRDFFESVAQLAPDYSNALYFLGLIYDKQGDSKGALELFRKISKLNPQNEEVKKIISNLISGRSALSGVKEAPVE